MTSMPFADISQYRDIEALNHYRDAVGRGVRPETVLASLAARARDHARTPMQWDASEHAGFTSGEPWLPVNPNTSEVNAKAAVDDPGSVFHHYRRLVELRHRLPVVVEGRFELLLPDDEQVWAFTRTLDEEVLLVLANCSSQPAAVAAGVPDLTGAEVLLGTHDPDGAPDVPGDALVLRPWESRVYRLPPG